ncbi:MAG TPA: hypothetical protein VKZ63_17520 [Kofleriaceae bacterium]|nr:hypothetical protein [Kofleriaceae bacterium]
MRSSLLAAALLGGCAAGPGDTSLEVIYDVCQPTLVQAAAGATEAERASIGAALDMWRARGGYPLFRQVPDDLTVQALPRVEVVFEEAADPFHGLYDDEHGVVYVNRRIEDDHARSVTIAHELGHAFGLWHVDRARRISVMNPSNLEVEPTSGDAAELAELWGPCAAEEPPAN